MRILIYGINYTPELTGVGKYTGEMAEWLASHGHQVRVVTAPPYYPAWKVEQGYSAWSYRYEGLFGVEVWRCPLWVPRQPSGFKRILHLASFAISSLHIALWQGLSWQPDIVFVIEPSIFCLPGALLTAMLGGAKTWLHIQDFELDAAFELGILPSSKRIRELIATIEQWFISQTSCVSTISESMLKRLVAKRVNSNRSALFPNWVDVKEIFPMSGACPLRSELGISNDAIVLLYSGSMGEKQGLEILILAAQQLLEHGNIIFAICGAGGTKKHLLKLAEGLPNVYFLNLQPVEKLNSLVNFATIHLLIQSSKVADLVMPSKLLAMFASGRPVIATALPHTQVARFVDGCGIVVPPEDVKALVDGILDLSSQPERCAQLGQAARKFAVNNWDQEEILGQVEQAFEQLVSDRPTQKSLGEHSILASTSTIGKIKIAFSGRQLLITPEEVQRLRACTQEIAQILHRNTSEEIFSLEEIESAVHQQMLENSSVEVLHL